MPSLIFISTSNGIYRYRSGAAHAERILGNKHTPGLFRKKGKGYFGICYHQSSGCLLAASREKLGTRSADKPTTDCKLIQLDPFSGKHKLAAELHDIHDVHQIACHSNHVLLTDTGKNRLLDYDLNSGTLAHIINIGEERKDINHINALYVDDEQLYIGLNNSGREESAILSVALKPLLEAHEYECTLNPAEHAYPLIGLYHTHDIEPYENDFLICSSEAGKVFKAFSGQALIKYPGWVRGLCASKEGLWIGVSPKAKRKNRHSDKLSGSIALHSHKDFTHILTIHLEGSGQVNDLIALDL